MKQASRSWNLRFDEVIKAFGFVQNIEEFCVYRKQSGSSIAFLVLYVDDILLIGNDRKLLEGVKEYLNGQFSMKDLGEAAYILGIKIYRDRPNRLLALSQRTYIDKILKRFSMDRQERPLASYKRYQIKCDSMSSNSKRKGGDVLKALCLSHRFY